MKRLMGLFFILLLSGCILGPNETALARELHDVRVQFVPDGLLIPATDTGRMAYRDELVKHQSQISTNPLSSSPLTSYLEASLASLSSVEKAEAALSLWLNQDVSLLDCGPEQPGERILQLFQEARTDALAARAGFDSVRTNTTIANELGADYLLQALATLEGMARTHTEMAELVQRGCIVT
ncbi:MAG: hypothetical protein Q8P05_05135 [Candidatus Diapherotrites archaeon]|nr:hypothetical protein [Candidatus Diapherotrites archaeon]MDZ4256181.1 hypothetical protein [archaeon]